MTDVLRRGVGVVAVLAALGMSAEARAQERSPTADHPWIGKVAPPVELPSVSGETVSLASFRGKFVVLHFAASW